MPDIIITDSLNTTGSFFDTSFEMPVEQDILLADYDKAVFKTVKTNIDHTITQKYINGNRLIIEGFFRISVFYQPPQGANITVITKKQSFQRQFDLPSAVTGHHFIVVNGETQYVNTRAVNSSRITVNGVYAFTVKAYTVQQIPVVTAVNSNTVCADSWETAGFSLCGRGIRQFSMEDELSIPRETDKILNISACCSNMTVLVYQDKVNIKGDVAADIAYTMPDSTEILHRTKNFVYNQVVDINGINDRNIAYADFSVVNFTVTRNNDTKKINGIITAQLDVKVFRRESVYIVYDAFSKVYDYSTDRKIISYDENIRAVNKKLRFSVEDAIGSGYTPVYHFINVTPPAVHTFDNMNTLKSKLTVSAIVKNSQNEYECFNKSRDIIIDIGAEINQDDEFIISCRPAESNISLAEDILKATVNINVSGFVIKRKAVTVLSRLTEKTDTPAQLPANALILYYGKKGERVFDIAMRYRTDTSLIKEENNLETEKLQEDRMLFIPAFGM